MSPTPSRSLGAVVAWCLTVAAVLSIVGLAAHMVGLTGIKISSRILEFSLFALYPSALVVAAAVALSLTGGTREGRSRRRLARWAEDAVAVCGAAVLAASAYSIVAMLAGGRVGAEDFDGTSWTSRISFVAMLAASGVLAAVALLVIGSGRRPSTAATVADDGVAAAGGIEVPRPRLLDPVVACVLVGATVLVFEAATTAFPRLSFSSAGGSSGFGSIVGPSVGSRLASVSSQLTSLPIAFAALAVVVLVVVRDRRQARDRFRDVTASVAAMIGLLAVLAAGHRVWETATGDMTIGASQWWVRASVIATALASGTLGAAAGYARAQRARATPAEPEPVRTRFDPRLVGLCLALAASGSALFIAITAVKDDFRVARGELLLQYDPFMLLSVGLALAAVIVVAFSRREPSNSTRRDAMGTAVDAIAAIVALGTLVATVFVIVYVVGYQASSGVPAADGPFSLLDHSSAAAKIGYVALALACGLLAAGVLRLVWDSSRPLIDEELDDPVPVVDLLP